MTWKQVMQNNIYIPKINAKFIKISVIHKTLVVSIDCCWNVEDSGWSWTNSLNLSQRKDIHHVERTPALITLTPTRQFGCQVLNTLKARTGESSMRSLLFHQGIMSYLIIDNNVNGAVGGVVGQVTQVEGLIHNTLAGKGGITMDQNTHHLSNKARHREEDKLR